jgi:hypothetical protein
MLLNHSRFDKTRAGFIPMIQGVGFSGTADIIKGDDMKMTKDR